MYVYTCLKRNITMCICYILSVDEIKAKVLLDSCPGHSPSDQGNRCLLNKFKKYRVYVKRLIHDARACYS